MKKSIVILLLFTFFFQYAEGQRFYRVKRLAFSNYTDWEIAPVPYKDGLVFMSNRPDASMKNFSDQDDQNFSHIYYVSKVEEYSYETKYSLLSNTLKSNFHEGPVSFANDDKLICYSRMNENTSTSGIFFADADYDDWVNIRPFEHNDPQYTYYTPFITADGNSLYFAANMEDSRGGYDIYVSKFSNGHWSIPENLGDKINSPEDDVYPYLHSSGRLYFSSKGHDTRGGSDIFYCDMFHGEWSDAVKLPAPINSVADDYTLIMSDDYSEGYFTSKRRRGSPDIYVFYTDFPSFDIPRPIQRNRWKYRFRENSLDSIDYSIFSYEWVINDTLHIPGLEIIYAFPRPGDYKLSFNVHNKLTDTTMYDVGNLFVQIRMIEQPVIVSRDTVLVNEEISFNARNTHLPGFTIEGFYWDFGDGMKSSGELTTHHYTFPGTYKVVLGIKEKVRSRKFEPETKAVFKEIIVLPEE